MDYLLDGRLANQYVRQARIPILTEVLVQIALTHIGVDHQHTFPT
jgi:hypothetical protein